MAETHAETIARRAVRALGPAYADCFSDRTRKLQTTLLVVSGILLLLALGVLQVKGKATYSGVELAVDNTGRAVLGVAWLICLYFELIVAARCYADWNKWRLKSRIGQLKAQTLSFELMMLRKAEQDSKNAINLSEVLSQAGKPLDVDARFKRMMLSFNENIEKEKKAAILAYESEEFESRFRASSNIRMARLLLETWFPLLFGFAALLLATIKIVHPPST